MRFQTIQKHGIIALAGVCNHTGVAHAPGVGLINQVQPNRGFSLKCDGVRHLRRQARVINDQHTIAFRGLHTHDLHPPLIQGGLVPDHLGQQTLQLLLIRARHDVGQRVAILGGMLGQQPGQVPFHSIAVWLSRRRNNA
ncbi:hypothetical protein TFLX_01475 [Thermoflexales bacterium]|nr:hypothetical protein TFLX_01475 [Thermoflexales bacterium]